MSEKKPEIELTLPTADEYRTLPRWARVAAACRNARRVQPLFVKYWPGAPEEHVKALDNAVRLGEQACAAAMRPDAARAARAADAAYAARAAAAAADDDAAAAAAATAAAATAATAAYAARAAARSATDAARASVIAAVRADFELLKALATAEGWDDQTPVPVELLGPLWPFGVPERWPDKSAPDNASEENSRLKVRLSIPDWMSTDEAAQVISDLYRHLNACDIASGGQGLSLDLDDWLVLVPSGQEVLS